MDKRLLTNRVYNSADYPDIKDNWYAIQEILEKYVSVKYTFLYDTCSSAGDWQGFFIQYLNKNYYLIQFNQENNYPRCGFTGFTGDIVCKSKSLIDPQIAYDIINNYIM